MNHAFLILAHDSPTLLQRIVDKLEAPNHFVFVHYDKKLQCPSLTIARGMVIPRNESVSVNWGGFSQIRATLILLRYAINFSDEIDYFHFISGHDYPCVTNKEFDLFFERVPYGRSFMHYDTDEEQMKFKEKKNRNINRWYLNDIHGYGMVRYIVGWLLNRFIPRKFEGDLYSGWNWFSWHRSLVEWVLSYCNNHSTYLKRFHYTNCCDEILFHTLLHSHIEELNIDKNNSLRYIDWYPRRYAETLPLVLDERDYQLIKESGALFCRKCFIDRSAKLLEMLDNNKVLR